jgi:hypothetical protein
MTITQARAAHPISIDTSPAFTGRCVERAVFGCDVDTAYGALFRVADWPDRLPHVNAIEVLYDDGQYQEFWMTVQSDTGGEPLRVRSVRNCTVEQIEFFQPTPPAFLRHHGGIWRFRRIGERRTEVEVTHVWNLNLDVAAATFAPAPGRSTQDQVCELLAGHSRLTLSGWQRALGSPAKDGPTARGEQQGED